MKICAKFSLLVIMLLFVALSARADQFSYSGNFTSDDQVLTFAINVTAPGTVTLRTYSYAGGVDLAGTTVPAGGFDPVLTLFDATGNFLVTNDDGTCGEVGTDPTTANCFDAYVSTQLAAGLYTVALTEADNLPWGNLSDGFMQTGNGDFTCPEFLGQAGAFCDASPSQRDSSYELDIDTPDVLSSPVPEPAPFLLLITGCGLVFCLRLRS